MKVSKIYVSRTDVLPFAAGKGIAVYPAQKGEDTSYVLLDTGRILKMKGSRLGGVGIPRYLAENGFELASPDDINAQVLADYVDIKEGCKLVEHACSTKAYELQKHFAGTVCTVVPFEESKPSYSVDVITSPGYVTTIFDMQTQFSTASVKVDNALMDISLAHNWLVGPNGDVSAMPRVTQYGGVVEQAVFTICNAGLGTLIGAPTLVPTSSNAEYPRGFMKFSLDNGDRVSVGITALDEVEVNYLRGTECFYRRKGLLGVTLGDAVGAIAAVLVRVREMDAKPVKKGSKKAA